MNRQQALDILRLAEVEVNADAPWCPWEPHPKQKLFLELDCYDALYGGAAGGGKSVCMMMAALQYVHVPGYHALIIRRTLEEMQMSGAVMDLAEQWLGPRVQTPKPGQRLPAPGRVFKRKDGKLWIFPSGASIRFGYLENENDKYRYQGGQFSFLGIDEATQIPESRLRYLFSRIRQPEDVDTPLRIRCTANPGGLSHDYIKDRYLDDPIARDEEGAELYRRVFVPAKLGDNPSLGADHYLGLMEQDEVTRRQLLHGEWIKGNEGLVFSGYSWGQNVVDELPEGDWIHVLGVDLGTSEITPSTGYAVVGFRKHHQQTYCLEAFKEAGETPSSIAERIKELQEKYGQFERIVMDQGGLGSGYINEMRQRHALPVEKVQKRDKLGFIRLLNGDLEHNRALIYEPEHLEMDSRGTSELRDELSGLSWNAKGNDYASGQPDHAADAYLYAWRECRHWMQKEQPPAPRPGTKEHDEAIAQQLKARRIERQNRKELPWYLKN